jgi:nucleolar protein 58
MLVLFETPAGYSLFKVSDEKKLAKTDADDMYEKFFSDPKKATKFMSLVSFQPFADTADAVSAAASCIEGKVGKSLKSFLKRELIKGDKKNQGESLAIADKLMASSLKEMLPGLKSTIMNDAKTHELFRGIRCYMDELMDDANGDDATGVTGADIRAMQLGLSHSLSRYKLKFSSDKVDTMVIQAVGLLDELDKEINTYAMRVKEWYGWHFPEMQAIVNDNANYSKVVMAGGFRSNFRDVDMSQILEDEAVEAALKEAAEVSMGTEISDMDIVNIQSLAEQVLSMTEYRVQLYEYLKNRMNAIAPNLTILVGELVGARLISHAGSLMNLAKQPASTVQILGAEKALFRALKTKHDTPKYGLIYHASLIGQAAPKHKGKISRVLAAKASLATRVDALSDDTLDHVDTTIGYEGRAKVEARLRQLEGITGPGVSAANGNGALTAAKTAKYDPVAAKSAAKASAYNDSSDMVLDKTPEKQSDKAEAKSSSKKDKKEKKKKDKEKKKRKADDLEESDDEAKAEKKKEKKAKKEKRKSK